MRKINILNERFNRLLVIKEQKIKECTEALWICLCDCGNKKIVSGTNLRSKHTQSCGCLKSEVLREGRQCGIQWSKSHEGRRVMSLRNSQLLGEKSLNWKDGKDEENIRLRKSQQAKEWRLQVFERDEYLCTECKTKGKKLNAHHIKPWSIFPEFRYDLNNGLTVCVDCHRNLHKINGNPKRKVS